MDAIHIVAAREQALMGDARSIDHDAMAPICVGSGVRHVELVDFATKLAHSLIVGVTINGNDVIDEVASAIEEAFLVGVEFAHMEAADVEASVGE